MSGPWMGAVSKDTRASNLEVVNSTVTKRISALESVIAEGATPIKPVLAISSNTTLTEEDLGKLLVVTISASVTPVTVTLPVPIPGASLDIITLGSNPADNGIELALPTGVSLAVLNVGYNGVTSNVYFSTTTSPATFPYGANAPGASRASLIGVSATLWSMTVIRTTDP